MWFEGGWELNFYGFWVAVGGTVFGIFAYVIALWQIAESRDAARKAAEAAKTAEEAARAAIKGLSRFHGFVGLADVCTACTSISTSFHAKQYRVAMERVGDLLRLMSNARVELCIIDTFDTDLWDSVHKEIVTVQEGLVRHNSNSNDTPKDQLAIFAITMEGVSTKLQEIKAAHAHNLGEEHATNH